MNNFISGVVGIVGKPNVGKSTLLNELLHQKICITSPKPNTTRYLTKGILTTSCYQIVFVDTPGIHAKSTDTLSIGINKKAESVFRDIDVVLWLVGVHQFTNEDEYICKKLGYVQAPIILIINKIDRVKDKLSMLPFLKTIQDCCNRNNCKIVNSFQLSAFNKKDTIKLPQLLLHYLHGKELIFKEDMVTDSSQQFLSAEIIREKLMRHLEQEIPYQICVEISLFSWEEEYARWIIKAIIWVNNKRHVAVIVGSKGEFLKKIGSEARQDLIQLTNAKVHLDLWVKVKKNWAANEKLMAEMGNSLS